MNVHVCKQCGARFVYCRACVFRPVWYKENGFCSKECYEASKNVVVEPEVVDEVILVDEPKQIEDVIPMEENTSVEIETDDVVLEEIPTEIITVVESTIKNETDTYKNKKNKYRVHE